MKEVLRIATVYDLNSSSSSSILAAELEESLVFRTWKTPMAFPFSVCLVSKF